MIEVCVTNLGAYNNGELIYERLTLPCTREEWKNALDSIGIGQTDEYGCVYEEWFLSDWECDIDGVSDVIGEYSNVETLNYLAFRLDDMYGYELAQFESAVACGDHCGSIVELIELCDSLDNYILLEDVDGDEDLGRYLVEECGCFDTKALGSLANYIDYEAYGRDVRIEEGGAYTCNGYCVEVGGRYDPFLRADIPCEYRLYSTDDDEDDEEETEE